MHRFVNNYGIELIKELEGFKGQAYMCSGGYLTIGYGHKLLPSDRYNKISKETAESILRKDLLRIERAVIKYIEVPLLDDQFTSLVSFAFNLGPAALQRSSLRQKINYNLPLEAGDEFLKWVYAGGKKMPGLLRRRKIERKLFLKCADLR